jgi:NAD+ kinase
MEKRLKSTIKEGSLRSVALFHNERKPEAVKALGLVRAMLERAGVPHFLAGRGRWKERLAACDLAVSIGGDGTMLRTARVLAPYRVPMLGVNAGGLGFLSGLGLSDLREGFRRILAGGLKAEPRTMLSVEMRRGARRTFDPHVALNDCVIRQGAPTRALTLRVECSGQYVTDYVADGLVVATSTGSTAYALSAGGPIVMPDVDAFILAPICPHAVTQRPLVISSDMPVAMRLVRKNPYDRPTAAVSLDGQVEQVMTEGDTVVVRRHPTPFMLILPERRTHFDLLRSKLKWGER